MSEIEVRAASDKFYDALNKMANGDASSMADVWSHAEWVTALHPIGGSEVGWNAVAESFNKVASMSAGGKIRITGRKIQVLGDAAYETAVEQGELDLSGHRLTIEHRVTNIYLREAGTWKLIHHHTDISPAMLDVIAKL